MSNTPAASAALPEPSAGDTREALAAECKKLVDGYGVICSNACRGAGRDQINAALAATCAAIDRLAALTEQPAAPDLMTVVERILNAGHLYTEDRWRLQAAWERAASAAPQAPQGLAAWLRAEAARHDTSPCRDDPAVRVHVETLRRWADELYSMPAAPAQEPQQPDPCPQCRPGVVCRTPKCGRLRAKAAAPSPLTMGRIYEAWHEIGADVAGLSWAKFAEALQHGQPAQGGGAPTTGSQS